MNAIRSTGLVVDYQTRDSTHRALDGVDLQVRPGELVGIVGESGSGKSTFGLLLGRLLPGNARVAGGELEVAGEPVLTLAADTMMRFRRDHLAFVFQNPIASLDPTMRVGIQLLEALRLHDSASMRHVDEWLERVGLRETRRVAAAYPHELSGGMAQRVAIAMALAGRPAVIIADEPTASLDASVRGRVLDVLFQLALSSGATLLFLSHDLRSVAKRCDRVVVMYGGRVVEDAASDDLFGRPTHPYSQGLLQSAPGTERRGERLEPIAGLPPILTGPSPGCAFAPRCGWSNNLCRRARPVARQVDRHIVLCHRAEQVLADSARVTEGGPA